MTASTVLAEARARSISLVPVGGQIRCKPKPPRDLLDRIRGLKPELLQLLRAERREESHRCWVAAYGRLGRIWPGREVVGRVRPDLLAEIGAAEEEAERLTVAYRAGSIEAEVYMNALERWEKLTATTVETVTAIASDGRNRP